MKYRREMDLLQRNKERGFHAFVLWWSEIAI